MRLISGWLIDSGVRFVVYALSAAHARLAGEMRCPVLRLGLTSTIRALQGLCINSLSLCVVTCLNEVSVGYFLCPLVCIWAAQVPAFRASTTSMEQDRVAFGIQASCALCHPKTLPPQTCGLFSQCPADCGLPFIAIANKRNTRMLSVRGHCPEA